MLLNEISQVEKELRRGFSVELYLSDEFTESDADEVVSKLGGKIFVRNKYPAEEHDISETISYHILYPTLEDADYAKKILRRLQRGKPQFELVEATVYMPTIDIRMRGG